MKETKPIRMVCISCPQGCALEIVKNGGEFGVEGNRCKKGIEYARQEITNPVRSITTTVRTAFRDFPRLSVKTDAEVPLADIFAFMREINAVEVRERLVPGNVVKEDLLGSGINLVATCDMKGQGMI